MYYKKINTVIWTLSWIDFLIINWRFIPQESLKEHEANQDMGDPKDLIDEYLKEMKEKEEEGNNDFYRRGGEDFTVW